MPHLELIWVGPDMVADAVDPETGDVIPGETVIGNQFGDCISIQEIGYDRWTPNELNTRHFAIVEVTDQTLEEARTAGVLEGEYNNADPEARGARKIRDRKQSTGFTAADHLQQRTVRQRDLQQKNAKLMDEGRADVGRKPQTTGRRPPHSSGGGRVGPAPTITRIRNGRP